MSTSTKIDRVIEGFYCTVHFNTKTSNSATKVPVHFQNDDNFNTKSDVKNNPQGLQFISPGLKKFSGLLKGFQAMGWI